MDPNQPVLPPLSRGLSNRIPPEIYDAVIDNFHSDKPTLKTCARVCKSWLPLSRFHLVKRSKLHPVLIGRFCHLLEPTFSTLPHHYIYLEVRQVKPIWPPWEQTILPNPSPRMPGIRLEKSAQLIRLLPRFTRLSSLDLVNVHFQTFGQIVDIICSLPALGQASLSTISWEDDSFDIATLTSPLCLHTLSLHTRRNEHIINWLISREQPPPIRTLSLSERSLSGCDLLQVLGSSVESLQLRLAVYQPDTEGIFVNAVDISHLPNLRSLDLDFLTSETKVQRPGSESSVFRKFLHDIESIQTSSNMDMEELTLRAPAYVLHNEFLPCFWKDVAETLERPGFRYFTTIRIVVGKCNVGAFGRDTMEKLIKEKLGGCESRGVLKVIFEKP